MVLDLLSTDMYVNYNVRLAHKIGLHASIYMTELLNINRKAIEKNKLVSNDFFKVNREYIEQRTTLSKKEQKDLDDVLSNLKILQIDDNSKDVLKLDTDTLTAVMLDDRVVIKEKVDAIVKRGRPTKEQIILNTVKAEITTNNIELKTAYEEWVDAVHSKQGWISKVIVQEGQKVIDAYTNKDLDLALQIIKIATMGAYRDMNWAISQFEKEYAKKYFSNLNSNSINTPQSNTRKVELSEDIY